MVAYTASTGEELWRGGSGSQRPILNGGQVVIAGAKFDVKTGQRTGFSMRNKSFTCGPVIGSKHLLVSRSGTFGYYEFGTEEIRNYGGMRIGCWVDATPAGGLVLVSDGAAQCGCSYLNQATMALEPQARN